MTQSIEMQTDGRVAIARDQIFVVRGRVGPLTEFGSDGVQEFEGNLPGWRLVVSLPGDDRRETLKVFASEAPEVSDGLAVALEDGTLRPWAMNRDGALLRGLGLKASGVHVVGQVATVLEAVDLD